MTVPRLGRWMLIAWLTLAGAGCATIRVTNPPRTATEQFLMSQAADQAVDQLSTDPLRDRLVYVDGSSLLPGPQSVVDHEGAVQLAVLDRQFLLAKVREHLLTNGVRLTNDRKQAQIILEVRSGALGVDRSDYLLGIPQVLVPAVGGEDLKVGGQGTLITPELSILKNIKQKGYASIAYVAYWRQTGEIVLSSGPFVGKTHRTDWWYFGIGPYTSGDIAPAKDGSGK